MRDTPDEETTDWRAVCGKTARPVRRAGRAKTLSDPYRLARGKKGVDGRDERGHDGGSILGDRNML
jgi:hypothetical protein